MMTYEQERDAALVEYVRNPTDVFLKEPTITYAFEAGAEWSRKYHKKEFKILDLTAGRRAIWYAKDHPFVTFLDKRPEVEPTIVCDTRSIPPEAGSGFNLLVYDPPHMNCGPNSNMSKVYGYHTTAEILDSIEKTGSEAHRVSVDNALMALKWNTHDIPLRKVFLLLKKWEPLFGHLTKDGPHSQTYWVMLRRLP
jgi:hypothetical protein